MRCCLGCDSRSFDSAWALQFDATSGHLDVGTRVIGEGPRLDSKIPGEPGS